MSATLRQQATPQPPAARVWAVLMLICGALFLEGLDIAMLNVAVPDIAADLELPTRTAHWVISAYVLGYAGFLLLGGRSSDRFGARPVFLGATTAFAVFSGVGGIASEPWVLIAARFVTGVAAGFMTPAGFSVVVGAFPEGPRRNRALSIYGALGAGGFVLGTVVGGLLTTIGWRWVFFVPMVIGALVVAGGFRLIPATTSVADRREPFDLLAALLATAGMVALVYALVGLGAVGGGDRAAVSAGVGVLLLIGFVVRQRRSRHPLVRPGLLTDGLLPWVAGAGLLFMAAFFSFQYLITLYLQDHRGWSPLATGMTFAVMGADMLFAPILAPLLVRRFGNVAVMTAGLLSAAAAFGLSLRLDDTWGYAELLPSLALVAVAFALVYGPLTSAATTGVPTREHGTAGGVVYTGFQFGGAVGLAVATIVLTGAGRDVPGLADFQRSLVVPAVLAVAAVTVGVIAGVRERRGVRAASEVDLELARTGSR